MNYSEYKHNIRSGDVIAFSSDNWKGLGLFSQLIRIVRRSEYNHVAIAWLVGEYVFVIEAVRPTARVTPLDKLGSFYHIPTEARWTRTTEEAALSFVGTPYSILDAIKAHFNKLRAGKVTQCAALVREVLHRDGFELYCKPTPDEVVEALQAMGCPIYYIQMKGADYVQSSHLS